MTQDHASNLREQAYAWLIAMQHEPSDDLRLRLQAWRGADPAHEAAWQAEYARSYFSGEAA